MTMLDPADIIHAAVSGLYALLDSMAAARTCLVLAGLLVCAAALHALKRLCGHDAGRPAGASLRVDLVYTLLVFGGAYGLLREPVLASIDSLLRVGAPFLYLKLMGALPSALQFILFLLVIDFCRYWKHRWLHARPFLRAVHSIHHSAEHLNFFTAYRIHIFEYLFDAVITFVPVVLLGDPPQIGLAIYIVLVSYNGFLHSGMNVSFGALDYVLVSPRFHAVHHSTERADYDANFGSLFSFWDLAFGTGRLRPSLPEHYGLPAANVPLSVSKQLVFPLAGPLRRVRHARLFGRS